MSAVKSTEIEGDVAIGRHVGVGGDVSAQGNVTVKKNVRIEGWLESWNIVGPYKGMFSTVDKLRETYPLPFDGWSALVGLTFPAAVYVVEGGKWVATGKTGGNPTDATPDLRDAIESITTDINSIRETVEPLKSEADADKRVVYEFSTCISTDVAVNSNSAGPWYIVVYSLRLKRFIAGVPKVLPDTWGTSPYHYWTGNTDDYTWYAYWAQFLGSTTTNFAPGEDGLAIGVSSYLYHRQDTGRYYEWAGNALSLCATPRTDTASHLYVKRQTEKAVEDLREELNELMPSSSDLPPIPFDGVISDRITLGVSPLAPTHIFYAGLLGKFVAYRNGIYYASWSGNSTYGTPTASGVTPTKGEYYQDMSTGICYKGDGISLTSAAGTPDAVSASERRVQAMIETAATPQEAMLPVDEYQLTGYVPSGEHSLDWQFGTGFTLRVLRGDSAPETRNEMLKLPVADYQLLVPAGLYVTKIKMHATANSDTEKGTVIINGSKFTVPPDTSGTVYTTVTALLTPFGTAGVIPISVQGPQALLRFEIEVCNAAALLVRHSSLPPRAFIELWTSRAGKYGCYNWETGFFELNGVTDLTYAEALLIYNVSFAASSGAMVQNFYYHSGLPVRTLFRTSSSGVNVSARSMYADLYMLEAVTVSDGYDDDVARYTDISNMFCYCRRLRQVNGYIYITTNATTNAFKDCAALEHVIVMAGEGCTALSFADCPKLAWQDVCTMIELAANTSPMTITLHPDVYDQMPPYIMVTMTEKNITLIAA